MLGRLKKDYGRFGGMAGVAMVLPILGSAGLIYLVYELGPWLQQEKEIGFFVFVLGMAVLSGFALMATNILGIVSGYAFDFEVGILAQILGILGAATIMFYIAKRFARENLKEIIESKPAIRAIHSALLNESVFRTLLIITLIRLSPAMPFAVTNFTLSAAGVSIGNFLVGTVIGMLPRSSAIVFVGSSLSELNFSNPQESWTLIFGIIATVVSLVVIGIFSKRALKKLTLESEISGI